MIRSLFMGAIAGMRSMTPLAVVSRAARNELLPKGSGAPSVLASARFSHAAVALATAELLGDKLPRAPNRIVAPGMVARVLTGAVAGMALAPASQRRTAAVLGAVGAVGFAYLSFGLRMRLIRRFGQTRTGIVEDALAVAGALWLVRSKACDE